MFYPTATQFAVWGCDAMAVTAVFDGHCVIYRSTESVVRALDWRSQVRFLDLHEHDQVAADYPWLDQADAMGQIHVVDARGRCCANCRSASQSGCCCTFRA
jgi:predicted DCC family thiol-disulfide oxidoreductase YuxK